MCVGVTLREDVDVGMVLEVVLDEVDTEVELDFEALEWTERGLEPPHGCQKV